MVIFVFPSLRVERKKGLYIRLVRFFFFFGERVFMLFPLARRRDDELSMQIIERNDCSECPLVGGQETEKRSPACG